MSTHPTNQQIARTKDAHQAGLSGGMLRGGTPMENELFEQRKLLALALTEAQHEIAGLKHWAEDSARLASELSTAQSAIAGKDKRIQQLEACIEHIAENAHPVHDPLGVLGGDLKACFKRLEDIKNICVHYVKPWEKAMEREKRYIDLEAENASLVEKCKGLEAEVARLDASETSLIGQRDSLEKYFEESLALCGIANGHEYEWTSAFGFRDAIELADETLTARITALEQSLAEATQKLQILEPQLEYHKKQLAAALADLTPAYADRDKALGELEALKVKNAGLQGIAAARADSLEQVDAELAAAKRELERARKDTERLDWLDSLRERHTIERRHKSKERPTGEWRIDHETDLALMRTSVGIFLRADHGNEVAVWDKSIRHAVDAAKEEYSILIAARTNPASSPGMGKSNA